MHILCAWFFEMSFETIISSTLARPDDDRRALVLMGGGARIELFQRRALDFLPSRPWPTRQNRVAGRADALAFSPSPLSI